MSHKLSHTPLFATRPLVSHQRRIRRFLRGIHSKNTHPTLSQWLSQHHHPSASQPSPQTQTTSVSHLKPSLPTYQTNLPSKASYLNPQPPGQGSTSLPALLPAPSSPPPPHSVLQRTPLRQASPRQPTLTTVLHWHNISASLSNLIDHHPCWHSPPNSRLTTLLLGLIDVAYWKAATKQSSAWVSTYNA